jgi:hypothetical protein
MKLRRKGMKRMLACTAIPSPATIGSITPNPKPIMTPLRNRMLEDMLL